MICKENGLRLKYNINTPPENNARGRVDRQLQTAGEQPLVEHRHRRDHRLLGLRVTRQTGPGNRIAVYRDEHSDKIH